MSLSHSVRLHDAAMPAQVDDIEYCPHSGLKPLLGIAADFTSKAQLPVTAICMHVIINKSLATTIELIKMSLIACLSSHRRRLFDRTCRLL